MTGENIPRVCITPSWEEKNSEIGFIFMRFPLRILFLLSSFYPTSML